MTTYYTQGENGEYSEVDAESMFQERKSRWQQTETSKIRTEVEASLRDELTPTIEKEQRSIIEKEFQPKLEDAQKVNTALETQLRQKTIAAEYGFKPGTEKYLGEGSEEDMRKEADNLKEHFATSTTPPEKKTSSGESAIQKRTGIAVKV